MNVNPTISGLIKFPLSRLFLGSFLLALTITLGRWWLLSSQHAQCSFPLAFYDIKNQQEVVLTQGIYRSYRDGFYHGHTSYVGTLSRFIDGVPIAPVTNIHRAIWYEHKFHYNLLKIKVTHLSRGLGDKSHDEDIREYVFPHIQLGDISVIGLYLLNGKVLASGTESAPRNICIK